MTASLTYFHLIPSSTKLYWPSTAKYQPVPPHHHQILTSTAQYCHVSTSSASYWPSNIIYQPILTHTYPLHLYQPVPHYTDNQNVRHVMEEGLFANSFFQTANAVGPVFVHWFSKFRESKWCGSGLVWFAEQFPKKKAVQIINFVRLWSRSPWG